MMYPSENLKIEFREVIFILMSREYKIAYICINLLCLCTIMLKLMIFYLEIKYKLNGLILLRYLAKESPFYTLNNNKQDIFKLMVNILFWYLRLFFMMGSVNLLIISLIMILYIYLFLEYNFNIFILFLSVIHAYLFYTHLFVMIIGGIVLIFIMIMFLNWKFDEIIRSMRLSVLWRNKVRLLDNMMIYNTFTELVHNISRPINYTIGFIFLITAPLISTTVILWMSEPKTLIELLIHLIIFIYIPIQIVLIYIFNHFCASIPLRNRSIAKYLYPVFYDKNFHRIQMHRSLRFYSYRTKTSNLLIHMKIDSFIARLNKQFVGFYCFNLFKFTKLAMLQYLSYFSTVYILFNKLIK